VVLGKTIVATLKMYFLYYWVVCYRYHVIKKVYFSFLRPLKMYFLYWKRIKRIANEKNCNPPIPVPHPKIHTTTIDFRSFREL